MFYIWVHESSENSVRPAVRILYIGYLGSDWIYETYNIQIIDEEELSERLDCLQLAFRYIFDTIEDGSRCMLIFNQVICSYITFHPHPCFLVWPFGMEK